MYIIVFLYCCSCSFIFLNGKKSFNRISWCECIPNLNGFVKVWFIKNYHWLLSNGLKFVCLYVRCLFHLLSFNCKKYSCTLVGCCKNLFLQKIFPCHNQSLLLLIVCSFQQQQQKWYYFWVVQYFQSLSRLSKVNFFLQNILSNGNL